MIRSAFIFPSRWTFVLHSTLLLLLHHLRTAINRRFFSHIFSIMCARSSHCTRIKQKSASEWKFWWCECSNPAIIIKKKREMIFYWIISFDRRCNRKLLLFFCIWFKSLCTDDVCVQQKKSDSWNGKTPKNHTHTTHLITQRSWTEKKQSQQWMNKKTNTSR